MSRPKFLKKFADANPEKAKRLEKAILLNVDYSQENRGKPYCFARKFSFHLVLLPPLQQYSNNVQELWNSAVCDLDMNDDLERAGVINWCPKTNRLFPIRVKSDGNCLIHAICTAIWGIEDINLNVRRLLSITLQTDTQNVFRTRWQQYQKSQDREMFNLPSLSQVNLDRDQWEREWNQVLYSARGEPDLATQMAAMPYMQLEAIHVYVIANILKRPIIILGKDTVNTFSGSCLQVNNLVGIYLPLERDAQDCCLTPVVLGLSMNHFCPLLGRDTQFDSVTDMSENYIPLITKNGSSLPVRFLMAANEERRADELLRKYLKLKEYSGSMGRYVGAVIHYEAMPHNLNVLQDYEKDFEQRCREYSRSLELNIKPKIPEMQQPIEQPVLPGFSAQQASTAAAAGSPRAVDRIVQQASKIFKSEPCKTQGCEFFGSPAQGGMCTQCLNKYLNSQNSRQQQPEAEIHEVEPSAPPPSFPIDQGYTDLSLMGQLCQSGCGYRCSEKTFPFCHECAEKRRRTVVRENPYRDPNPATPHGDPILDASPRDPILAASSSTRVETNECQPVPDIEMNNMAMSENPEVAIPEANLFGSGQQLTSPMQESCGQMQLNVPVLEVTCIIPQCTRKGLPHQGNRCNRCFVENIPQSSVAESTQIAPSDVTTVPPKKNLPRAVEPAVGGLKKCVTPACVKAGLAGNHGYCTECALKYICNNISSAPTIEAHGHKMPQSAHTNEENIQKMICSKPGCDGMRLKDNMYGLCKYCYLQDRKPSSPVENSAMAETSGYNELESNILESGTPSGASGTEPLVVEPHHKKKCASPMCKEMIYPPHELCNRCLEILRKHLPPQNSFSAPTPARRIYTAPMNPVVVPGPPDRQRSQSAPHGKKCIMPNCTKYGDPATADMCTTCYTYQMEQARTSPVVIQPMETVEASENNTFLKMMNKVVNNRKTGKCKKVNCGNYGNPAKEGFCNTCHPEYLRMQNGSLWSV